MKARPALAFALFALGLTSASANAFPVRAPQVMFVPASLQNFMNVDNSGTNVTTDQLDTPTWSTATLGNTGFALSLDRVSKSGDAIGICSFVGASPTLYEVFPATAAPGWYAAVDFIPGHLVVSRFDENSGFLGQTLYPTVDKNAFGFYVKGACGTFFSQDALNQPAAPQALTYVSIYGSEDFWLCFETCPYASTRSTFDGEVFELLATRYDPARHDSWGHVKGIYR